MGQVRMVKAKSSDSPTSIQLNTIVQKRGALVKELPAGALERVLENHQQSAVLVDPLDEF